MNVPYVGNSTYCFTNSLAMCLKHSSDTAIPEVGFIECATLMPFGAMYLDFANAPLFFPNPANTQPDRGLTDAISNLGWTSEIWRGDDPQTALAHLRDALEYGPVLLGPLDMGHLSYDPNAQFKHGGDHFIVALQAEGDLIVVHDPQLYPYATIPAQDLLWAWNGSHLGYVEQPFTMRFGFRAQRQVTRREVIEHTLETARAFARQEFNGPVVYSGRAAFERAATAILGEEMRGLKGLLVNFALPVGARRSLDAAAFVAEVGASDLAESFRTRAERFGRAQFLATQQDWKAVAGAFEELGVLEEQLQQLL